MINKIKITLRRRSDTGIFHDSRKAERQLAEVCTVLIEKANELVDKVNDLEKKMGEKG